MTKQEILEYILKTPENTNPTILEQLLNELEGEGGQLPDNVWAQSIRDEYGTNFIDLSGLLDKTMIVGGYGFTTKTKSEWGDLIINHDGYECDLVVNSLDVIKTYPLIWNESESVWELSNDEATADIEYNKSRGICISAEYTAQEEMTEEQKINTTLQIVVNKK